MIPCKVERKGENWIVHMEGVKSIELADEATRKFFLACCGKRTEKIGTFDITTIVECPEIFAQAARELG